MTHNEWKSIIEGLVFVSGSEGIDLKTLSDVLELDKDQVVELMAELREDFHNSQRGLQIVEIGGYFQMTTKVEHALYLEKLAASPSQAGLSQAALETLAIIAYKQPITRAEIEEIRGVKCEKAIHTLTSKKLIGEKGRAETTGRPILYGTTQEFMEHFGLKHMQDLPPVPFLTWDEEVEREVQLLFQKSQGKD